MRAFAAAAILAMALGAWGCGSDSNSSNPMTPTPTPAPAPTPPPPAPTPTPTPPPPGGLVTINVVGINGAQSFSPNPSTLPAGQMVVWHNVDSITHRVVLNDGSLDTGNIAGGSVQPADVDQHGQPPVSLFDSSGHGRHHRRRHVTGVLNARPLRPRSRRFHVSGRSETVLPLLVRAACPRTSCLRRVPCTLYSFPLVLRPAYAQAVIKVNEDVNFKFGVLGQFQADTISNPEPEPNTNNLFVRRLRLMFAGQVAKNVTFFVQTDAPNLGKELPAGKNIQPSVILQDAYASVKVADALIFDAGLVFVPGSRDNLTLTATLLPIDYGPFTFSDATPEESTLGRDTGFQARGYLLGNRLEYRLGAFQGFRDAGSDNPFRYAGRVQYNLLDTEQGYLYTGTSLGKKKILAVGATFDAQRDFRAYDADVFFDHPLGPGAVTCQFDYNHFDGGSQADDAAKAKRCARGGGVSDQRTEADAAPPVRAPGHRRRTRRRRNDHLRRRELLVGGPERQRQGGVLTDQPEGASEAERVHGPVPSVLLLR